MKWLVVATGICLLVGIAGAQTLTIEQEESLLWSYAGNNTLDYIAFVGDTITNQIHFDASPYYYVNSTDIAWKYKVGDCSEQSLIAQRMIVPYINSEVVHGWEGKEMHDTVKWYYEGQWGYYDHAERKGFKELGMGLAPKEYIRWSE